MESRLNQYRGKELLKDFAKKKKTQEIVYFREGREAGPGVQKNIIGGGAVLSPKNQSQKKIGRKDSGLSGLKSGESSQQQSHTGGGRSKAGKTDKDHPLIRGLANSDGERTT